MDNWKLEKHNGVSVLVKNPKNRLLEEVADNYNIEVGHGLIKAVLNTIDEHETWMEERYVNSWTLEGLNSLLEEDEKSGEFADKLEIALNLLYSGLLDDGTKRKNYESRPETDFGRIDS